MQQREVVVTHAVRTAIGGINNGIADVGNILDARDPAASAANAAVEIPLKPVVILNDGLNTRVEASQVSLCLRDVVKMANDAYAALTEKQQHALRYMYQVYAPVMESWDDSLVGNFRPKVEN